jgi:ribose transport system ATP-binding protein
MDGEALRVAGIVKHYGATIALDGVDFTVNAGEVHALVGENGAGKSTLVNVLAGAVQPDRGEMWIHDARYRPSSPHDARRSGIALIHQELSLCPHLSVEENLLLGGEVASRGWIDRTRSRERALELLAELPHPEIRPERCVGALSLPARQIVEICRTLAADARVVLMDEPTSSLQGSDVDRLFALIRRLTARGIAVVYISHFLEEVRAIAERVTVLRDGRTVATGATDSMTNEQIVVSMVGRAAMNVLRSKDRRAPGETALTVRGLSAPPRLAEASFDLHRGEILGIAGLIGSGRTELVRAIYGIDTPASGTVIVHGREAPATEGRPRERVREGVGYLSEDRAGEGLALPLSITDNLCATRPLKSRLGMLDVAAQHESARHWIRELSVRAFGPAQAVRSLSGGNQQKVAAGRLLHQQADILLLDEPTRGIDVGSRADVYDIIVRQAESGCAVLMVSSYLPELFGLCDRLAVMCRGRLSPVRAIDEWTPESALATAMGS